MGDFEGVGCYYLVVEVLLFGSWSACVTFSGDVRVQCHHHRLEASALPGLYYMP